MPLSPRSHDGEHYSVNDILLEISNAFQQARDRLVVERVEPARKYFS